MTDSATATDGDLLRLTRCPQCEYSLEGLPTAGTCPECGRGYDQSVVIIRCHGFGSERLSTTMLLLITLALAGGVGFALLRWPAIIRISLNSVVLLGFVVALLGLSWLDRITSLRPGVWLLWIAPAGIGVQTEFDPSSLIAQARVVVFNVFWPLYLLSIYFPLLLTGRRTDHWLAAIVVVLVFGGFSLLVFRLMRGKIDVPARGVQPNLTNWKGLDVKLNQHKARQWRLRAWRNVWIHRQRRVDVKFDATEQFVAQLHAAIRRMGGMLILLEYK